ncbi:MAG: DUF695 domain-containing protein [Gammaproteobacteria bacterium]
MTDHWEVFPCQIGDHNAFVAYDQGLSETIDGLTPTSLLKIKATLRAPTDQGMPQKTELDQLGVLEDALEAQVREYEGVPVGRVTVAGLRIFYYYVDLCDADAQTMVEAFARETGYELRHTIREDSVREGYWQDLYPSEDERQVAGDMRTIDQLRVRGDDLSVERRLDHWAYFSSTDDMDAFVTWLSEAKFEVNSAQAVNPADSVDASHSHRVQFYHLLAPTLANVSDVTVALSAKARELNGAYDGWETSVQDEALTD